MNNSQLYLETLGFVNGDMKQDFGDLSLAKYVKYLMRKVVSPSGNRFEYIWLISYEDNVVEIVGEVYAAKKNTYKPKGGVKLEDLIKKGFVPVKLGIIRSHDELVKFLA